VNASAREEAILFHMDDAPAMQALDLYRTEAYAGNDGRQ
jgi:gentisate 1,2-dioxygenase